MSRSIHIKALAHSNPVPSASRVGNFIASSLISGRNPKTGAFDGSVDEQCAYMLANVKTLIEAAGGDLQSILRVTVWMNDRSQREALNKPWVVMFPDADCRPARLTLNRDLDSGKLVECEFIAVLQD